MVKQSSIDLLIEEVKKQHPLWRDIFIKVKAMYKDEVINAYYQGVCDESDNHGAQYIDKKQAEKWYNETFNK